MTDCVGCGFCCIKTPCHVAMRLYPGVKHCPQLQWNGSRYVCGLMILADPLGAEYRKQLYAGAGCCCTLNDWRRDVKKREVELNRTVINPIPEIMQIFLKCLAGNFVGGDLIKLTIYRMADILEKKGYAEDEIRSICMGIEHTFSENRHSFIKDFMG